MGYTIFMTRKVVDRLMDDLKIAARVATGQERVVSIDGFGKGRMYPRRTKDMEKITFGMKLQQDYDLDFVPEGFMRIKVEHDLPYQNPALTIIPESLHPRKRCKLGL
jgi:hypothetical protein